MFAHDITALEFFAGIGLARLGLEQAGVQVVYSNEIAQSKVDLYRRRFPAEKSPPHRLVVGDIAHVSDIDLPSDTMLAWASSPCTDLSLAGSRAGLNGNASGTLWEFVRILDEMGRRKPPLVVIENVVGLASSRGGKDLINLVHALNDLDYSMDVLLIDAVHFVPQSRKRLFLVGVDRSIVTHEMAEVKSSSSLRPAWLMDLLLEPGLKTHQFQTPDIPKKLHGGLGSIVERIPVKDKAWWSQSRVDAALNSLSKTQQANVSNLISSSEVSFRTAFRRTRHGAAVWEVRSDDCAGCLRTPRGGSSKQAVFCFGGGEAQARWITIREQEQLMGASGYDLDGVSDTAGGFGFGDGVVVPVVRWLGENYLKPVLQ